MDALLWAIGIIVGAFLIACAYFLFASLIKGALIWLPPLIVFISGICLGIKIGGVFMV